MIVEDKVYGTVDISDPVIVKILNSKVFLRLQKISQFGVPDKYYHIKGYSRFEHSIGVMLLLRKLGASYEEQIAGLLHDISHTAFSHTVDWVIGTSGKEDFQDKRHAEFANHPELKQILKDGGLSPDRIFNFGNYNLLDSEIPDLCADRIDYALREFSIKDAKLCISHLCVVNKKIVFDEKTAALLFANNFLTLQSEHWGGFEAASRWYIFAEVLKRGLDLKVFEFSDFFKDDDFVTKKIELSRDAQIKKLLSVLTQKSLADLPKSSQRVHKKFRYVDPEFISGKNLKRLSKVDSKFALRLKKLQAANQKGAALPIYS